MFYLAIFVLILISLGLTFIILYTLTNFWVRRSLRPKDTIIAKNLLVGDRWIALESQKPAKPKGHTQHVYLNIPGYEFDWQQRPFNIQLSDGTIVHPKIEVVDKVGNCYEAKDGTRWGNLVGFSLKPDSESNAPLSDDQQNVRLRICSAEPFKCAEIGWRTKRMK